MYVRIHDDVSVPFDPISEANIDPVASNQNLVSDDCIDVKCQNQKTCNFYLLLFFNIILCYFITLIF